MIRKSFLHSKATASRAVLRKSLGAAVVSAAAVIAPAHAGTINFEGYYGPVGGTEYIQQAGYTLGFYAYVADGGVGSLVGSFMDGTDASACVGMACPVNNPGTYYAALNDSYIDIVSDTAAAQFRVKSFDASFIGASPVLGSYPFVSGLLRLQGFTASGGAMVETYQLNGPGANGFNFGHFNTSAAFGNNAFVEVLAFGFSCNAIGNCLAFQSNLGQFGIDNIELVNVPEPSSVAMIGLGLFAMLGCVRRRKA